MFDVNIEIDLGEFERLAQEFPKRAGSNLKIAMRKSLAIFRRRLIERSPVLRDAGDGKRRARRIGAGGLSRSFTWRVKGTRIRSLEGVLRSDSYAAVGLETGERYDAKDGKYLIYPIGFALSSRGRRAGKVKRKYRSYAAYVSSQGIKKFSFTPTRDKRGWIVWEKFAVGRPRKDGSRRIKYRPVYLMVRSINPKPKLGMFKLWREFEPKVLEIHADALEAAMRGEDLK